MKSVANNNRTAIPEGKYECVCSACSEKTSLSGKPYVEFDFLIRKDVEQSAQGRHIFKKFFKDDNGNYPEAKIGKYANALGIPAGSDFEYWQLRGMLCVVAVKNFKDDETGEMRDCVFFTESSKYKPKEVTSEDFSEVDASGVFDDANADFSASITKDDIPF